MVAHAFNPSTWEAKAGGFLSMFQDSQEYRETLCIPFLKKPNQPTKQTNKQKQKKKKKKKILMTSADVIILKRYLLQKRRKDIAV
jgi:formyltetrahydrofolate hydrolase